MLPLFPEHMRAHITRPARLVFPASDNVDNEPTGKSAPPPKPPTSPNMPTTNSKCPWTAGVLICHVVRKGMQLGSLVALIMSAPAFCALFAPIFGKAFGEALGGAGKVAWYAALATAGSWSARGAVVGGVVAAVLGAVRVASAGLGKAEVEERVARLRKSGTMQALDKASLYGGMLGAVAIAGAVGRCSAEVVGVGAGAGLGHGVGVGIWMAARVGAWACGGEKLHKRDD